MKLLTLLMTFLCIAATVSAQEKPLLQELPKGKKAFVKSEPAFINSVNWLEQNPANEEVDKRKQQMALIIAWITDAPAVTVEVDSKILTFTEKNSSLLVLFMGGWTRYSLQHDYSNDAVQCNLAGIRTAINVYKKGIEIVNDDAMDKLVSMDEKGELEDWVKKQLGKK